MPGLVMIEAMAQVAGVLGFYLEIQNVKPKRWLYLFIGFLGSIKCVLNVKSSPVISSFATPKNRRRHGIYKFGCCSLRRR